MTMPITAALTGSASISAAPRSTPSCSSDDGAVLFEKRVPTPKSYDAILAAIAGLVREAAVEAGRRGDGRHRRAGLGLARRPACGATPISSPATASRCRPISSACIGRAVRLENDANCFALSEAYDGAGAGHAVVACFTIGTALGGGLVIDGKLRHGPNNEAAEFGHTPMPWPNESEWPLLPCFCGKKGCVEQYVSGTGLARDYAQSDGRGSEGAGDRRQGARRRGRGARRRSTASPTGWRGSPRRSSMSSIPISS